eukprot:gene14904-16448_t
MARRQESCVNGVCTGACRNSQRYKYMALVDKTNKIQEMIVKIEAAKVDLEMDNERLLEELRKSRNITKNKRMRKFQEKMRAEIDEEIRILAECRQATVEILKQQQIETKRDLEDAKRNVVRVTTELRQERMARHKVHKECQQYKGKFVNAEIVITAMHHELSQNKWANNLIVARAVGRTETGLGQLDENMTSSGNSSRSLEMRKLGRKPNSIDLAANFRTFDVIRRKKELEFQVKKLQEKIRELIASNGLTYYELQERSKELGQTEEMLVEANTKIRELKGENKRLKEYLNNAIIPSPRVKKRWMRNPFKRT